MNLTKTPVIRKDGVHTYVWKKLPKLGKTLSRAFGVPPTPASYSSFEDLSKIPDAVNIDRRKHFVARNDSIPAVRCPLCLTPLSTEDSKEFGNHQVECAKCHTTLQPSYKLGNYHRVELGIRAKHLKYLDTAGVKGDFWYHITINPNWGEDLRRAKGVNNGKPFVHLGQPSTLLDRAYELENRHHEQPIYVYKVRIKPQAKISNKWNPDTDGIHPEDTNDLSGRYSGYSATEVNRYINAWEDAGTVSLMTVMDNIQVLERLTQEEFEDEFVD